MLGLTMAVPERFDNRPSLVADNVTDADSICETLGRRLRARDIKIPEGCRCLCLKDMVQESLDAAPIKNFVSAMMESRLMNMFMRLPPQSSPKTTAA